MSDVINTFLQKFVATFIAVSMTGLLAWSVIESTTIGPIDQITVRAGA